MSQRSPLNAIFRDRLPTPLIKSLIIIHNTNTNRPSALPLDLRSIHLAVSTGSSRQRGRRLDLGSREGVCQGPSTDWREGGWEEEEGGVGGWGGLEGEERESGKRILGFATSKDESVRKRKI
jgi:hypothetical protein